MQFPLLKWHWPPVTNREPTEEEDLEEVDESPETKKSKPIEGDPDSSDDDIPKLPPVINFREDDGDDMTVSELFNLLFFFAMSCQIIRNSIFLKYLQVADKLKQLSCHLRERYHYCLWCGIKYDDARDLDINCPGLTKNDH